MIDEDLTKFQFYLKKFYLFILWTNVSINEHIFNA